MTNADMLWSLANTGNSQVNFGSQYSKSVPGVRAHVKAFPEKHHFVEPRLILPSEDEHTCLCLRFNQREDVSA